jgi:hypothetical protein
VRRLAAVGNEYVDRTVLEWLLVADAPQSVQSCCRETGQRGVRGYAKLRGAEHLRARQGARVGDHDTAHRLLPAAGGELPAQLVLCHEAEHVAGAEHRVVPGK